MIEYEYEYYGEKDKSAIRCYVKEFEDERTGKERGKIIYFLNLLKQKGPTLDDRYAEKLNDEIYELKPRHWNTEMRMFYFWEGRKAIFVHAIVKKKQKTPAGDIDLADTRRKRYLKAKQAQK